MRYWLPPVHANYTHFRYNTLVGCVNYDKCQWQQRRWHQPVYKSMHAQIKGKIVFKYTPFNYWNWIIDNKRSKQQPSHDPQRVHEYPNDNCCNYLILVLFWFIFISFIEKCCRKQKHVNAFKSAPEQRNLPTTLLDLFKEPGAWNTHISFTIFSGFEINDWCDCKNTAPC